MTLFYAILSTGVGLTLLLLYVRHLIQEQNKLKHQTTILKAQKEYLNEVTQKLSKPQSIDDTIDLLQDGKF